MSNTSADYLLSVDVGNSRIKFGLFNQHDIIGSKDTLPTCLQSTSCSLAETIDWKGIGNWPELLQAENVFGAVSGANPAGIDKIVSSWPENGWDRPKVVSDPDCFPLKVHAESARQVGIDRLLNAVAANILRPAETPAIIVDTGTATTVDVLSTGGAFEGGAILPGFELFARSLHQYTALLPLVSIRELARKTPTPLGKNTSEAMESGLLWGQLGAVKELISQLVSELRSTTPDCEPLVLITGGGAPLLVPHLTKSVRYEPRLALQGLALVAEGCGCC